MIECLRNAQINEVVLAARAYGQQRNLVKIASDRPLVIVDIWGVNLTKLGVLKDDAKRDTKLVLKHTASHIL